MFIHNCTARLLSNQTLHRTGIVKAGSRQIILSYFVCNARKKKAQAVLGKVVGFSYGSTCCGVSRHKNITNVQKVNNKTDGLLSKVYKNKEFR